jgi:hypothetical protein
MFLSFLAIILIIGWIFAFLIFSVGGALIHILLAVALIAIIMQILTGKKAARIL